MKSSIKRLLSLLIVMAMVVSMIVPANFSFAKAETTTPATSVIPEAAQAEIAKGKTVKERSEQVKDQFLNATEEVTAVCPVCGEEKTWTPVTGTSHAYTELKAVVAMTGGHYYIAEDIDVDYFIPGSGFFSGYGCINLNGKTVTLDGTKFAMASSTAGAINIMDTAGTAVVTGSTDQYGNDGRALQVYDAGCVMNVFGGTFQGMADTVVATGGTANADAADGSATVAIRGGTLNVYEGATIVGVNGNTGNTAKWGGAVIVGTKYASVLNMYGGTIRGGKATNGGSICAYVAESQVNMYGGEIIGTGKSGVTSGGNVYLNSKGVFTMYDGSIRDGFATNGGNVYVIGNATAGANGVFNMHGGEILDGTATYGGNFMLNSNTKAGGVLNMDGGFIGGGYTSSAANGRNVLMGLSGSTVTAALNMSGGTIVGDVCASSSLSGNKTLPISGSAKIVTQAYHNGTLYTGTYGAVKISFTTSNLGEGSYVMLGQGLAETWGWCDACGAPKKWTAIDGTADVTVTSGGHYRIKNDIVKTYETVAGGNTFLNATQSFCLDLSGYDVTVNGGRFLTAATAGKTVNVYDKVGDSIVKASNDIWGNNGMIIQLASETATVNLYGGTYKAFDSDKTPEHNDRNASPVRVRGGVLNLFEGAVIDGRDMVDAEGNALAMEVATIVVGNTDTNKETGVTTVTQGTFNLKGGTVYGVANKSSIDAIRVGHGTADGTVNIESGTIVGAGGVAVQVRDGSTLNISGGEIQLAEGEGGAVGSYKSGETGVIMNISGGVLPTVNAVPGSTLTLSGKPVIGMLYTNDNLANVDGLSTEADITVNASAGTVLTAATENNIGNAIKHTNPELSIKKNADNQYYIADAYPDPVKGEFEPELCGGKAYCPICGTIEKWTAVTEPTKMEGGHYYLADHIEDAEYKVDNSGYITGSGCLNLNGKNVTLNGGGRFLFIDDTNVATVMDTEGTSVIKGSCDNGVVTSYYGATVRVNAADSVLNLYGGTYERIDDAETENDFGVSVVGVRGGTLNIYEGTTIQNGDIAAFEDARGGNLYINSANEATVNMYGGAILNGKAVSGGNIFANAGATLNIEGGFIGGGSATGGPNIWLNTYENSPAISFTVKGTATIVGGIGTGLSQTMIVAGTPKIVPSAEYAGETYTTNNGTTKVHFDMSTLEKGAEIWFNAAMTETVQWCDHCDKMIKWTNISAPIAELSGHARLVKDVTYTYEKAGNNIFLNVTGGTYIDLAGYDLTVIGGSVLVNSTKNANVNIVDTVGGSVVTGSYDFWGGQGRTLMVNAVGATLNLYGGTYKGTTDGDDTANNATAVVRMREGGTINLYEGAVIDGRGLEQAVATVYMGNETEMNTFNVKGGTVYGGKNTTTDGGTFRVGNVANTATLNLESGKIVAGICSAGEAVQARTGNFFNMTGGEILKGEGNNTIVYAQTGGNISISGGKIGGRVQAEDATATITLAGAPTISELKPNGVQMEINELTAEAKIGLLVNFDEVFTTAYEGEVADIAGVFNVSLSKAQLTKNEAGQLVYVKDPTMIPSVDKFEPEKYDGEAYCPICKDFKIWTAIDSKTEIKDKQTIITMDADHDHYYFAEDLNLNYSYALGGFINGTGCLNLNGKTITLNGAKLVDLTAGNTMNIIDTVGTAVVTGSCDYYGDDGKVLRVHADGAILNLYGGTYMGMNDTYSAYGNDEKDNGSGTVAVRGGILNIYEGVTIIGVDGTTGNTTKNGGAVVMTTAGGTPVVNMYGGVIKNGKATNAGNIYIVNAAGKNGVFNLYDGEILNGNATYGGNIVISSSSATAHGVLNVYGGFIAGGTAGAQKYGHNIFMSAYGNATNGYASSAEMNMSGGTVVGYIAASENLPANHSINFSDKARLVRYGIDSNGNAYTAATTLTKATFSSTNMKSGGELWGTSNIVYKWCDDCGAVKNWTITTAPAEIAANGHAIFNQTGLEYTATTSDAFTGFLKTKGNACIELNGANIKINNDRFLYMGYSGVVNVRDSIGGATVAGSNEAGISRGRVLAGGDVNSLTINLRGGTYTGFVYGDNTVNATPLVKLRQNTTMNLYEGATIDGSGMTHGAPAVFIGEVAGKPCTFNMEGGTVIGCTNTSGNGGAFRVGNGTGTGTLNVNSGKIVAGKASVGDAIHVRNGNTLNVTGGLIVANQDGTSGGGVIYIMNEGIANISGGVIVGYIYQSATAEVSLSGAPIITTEYTVDGVTYEGTYGLRPRDGALFNVDGLTEDAQITISADFATPFTEPYTGSVDMSNVFAFSTVAVLSQNAERQFMLVVPKVLVGDVAYSSVKEALENYNINDGVAIAFLEANVTISKDILLDVAASAENLVISGSGTVYGFDTSNDDYEGYIKITVSGDVQVANEAEANGNRYMALKEGNQYGFHRFVTRLTNVTLRTTEAGLYYKAEYKCDAVVRDRVKAYGVVLSTKDMPGVDFLADNGNLYTVVSGTFAKDYKDHTVKTTSGSVFGILKTTRDPALNSQYMTIDIYANAYIWVDVDGEGEMSFFLADTKNDGKKRTDEGFTGVARNLLEVVAAINDPAVLEKLSDAQKTNLINFANDWADQFDADGKAKWAEATSNITA